MQPQQLADGQREASSERPSSSATLEAVASALRALGVATLEQSGDSAAYERLSLAALVLAPSSKAQVATPEAGVATALYDQLQQLPLSESQRKLIFAAISPKDVEWREHEQTIRIYAGETETPDMHGTPNDIMEEAMIDDDDELSRLATAATPSALGVLTSPSSASPKRHMKRRDLRRLAAEGGKPGVGSPLSHAGRAGGESDAQTTSPTPLTDWGEGTDGGDTSVDGACEAASTSASTGRAPRVARAASAPLSSSEHASTTGHPCWRARHGPPLPAQSGSPGALREARRSEREARQGTSMRASSKSASSPCRSRGRSSAAADPLWLVRTPPFTPPRTPARTPSDTPARTPPDTPPRLPTPPPGTPPSATPLVTPSATPPGTPLISRTPSYRM